MCLFKGLQIALDLGYGLSFKKKTKLRKKIVENGGTISYIVTKKCHIVVTADPEKCDVSSKCRMAIKYGLPVLRLDYILDSLHADKVLPYDSYVVGGKSKVLDFKSGKISAVHGEKPKKYSTKLAFNPKTVKVWAPSDNNKPWFNEDKYEVAKYAVFTGFNTGMKCQLTTVIELHTSLLVSDMDESKSTLYENNKENQFHNRVVTQTGRHKDLEAGKSGHAEVRYLTTAEQALSVFTLLYENIEKKGDMKKCKDPVRGIGSLKLQKLMSEVVDVNNSCCDEVKELVEHLWREAMAEVTSVLGDIKEIKLEQVEKAEAILLKIRNAIKASSSEKTIQDLINDFYSTLHHTNESSDVTDRKRWLAKKQDMCQLIKDMIAVSELTNYETRAQVEAKYAALRCRITHLSGDQRDEIKDLIKSSLEEPIQDVQVLNVYEVWRWAEDVEFLHDLSNKQLLFHSSKTENFVGILSRGLLLPKIIVDDYGGKRTDAGMLGSGIYFASAASTCVKYSSPSSTKGSRLLLVNEVALGACKDYTKFDLSLTSPPEGYNSTHGVSKKLDKSSQFQNDEYVVYSVNQQRLRYLVEFIVPGDKVRPLEEIHAVDTNILCDAVEHIGLQDVTGVSDPLLKIKPGLMSKDNQEVELKCVHIRVKLVDLAAQVVVLQEYYNNSHQAIEAKYVFPLDDTAAVCGFEAFINGKHIVGEVKEKEVAHKEYKEAISQGHGAYLMDQDEETPDVFTVSVGNLPPNACVLIKITYVTELQIEDEQISFRLPATVAPWKEDTAFKQSTQEELQSHKMKALKTTVQVAVEMPFEIRSLSCPTHKIRIKQTASTAFLEMLDNQTFGSGFQLLIRLAEIHMPRMWVERHPKDSGHHACMLTFYPEFESEETLDGEIVLILDTSNSMKGTSITEAKKVALLVLQNIPSGWLFNVIRFGSDFEELFPSSKSNNDENMQLAISFVQNSVANKGNTDIIRPLHPLFLLPRTSVQRNVFLISDGHINDSELVFHQANQNSRHTRVFSFGVSDTCNIYTLKALSRLSGGAFEFFSSRIKSKWEHKVRSQVSKARQPGLTSVSVEWHQYNDNLPPPVQAPKQITALFNGSHLVVYGFVPDCTMATLTANIDGQQVSTVVSTSELSITEGQLVHRLTARAVIRDWNDGILSKDRTEHEVAKMDYKDYIIELSKEHSIVTQFTSFIAVEKREENEKDLPKEGPSIEDLVKMEDLDFLSYMGWTRAPEDDSHEIQVDTEGGPESSIELQSDGIRKTSCDYSDILFDLELDSAEQYRFKNVQKKKKKKKPQQILVDEIQIQSDDKQSEESELKFIMCLRRAKTPSKDTKSGNYSYFRPRSRLSPAVEDMAADDSYVETEAVPSKALEAELIIPKLKTVVPAAFTVLKGPKEQVLADEKESSANKQSFEFLKPGYANNEKLRFCDAEELEMNESSDLPVLAHLNVAHEAPQRDSVPLADTPEKPPAVLKAKISGSVSSCKVFGSKSPKPGSALPKAFGSMIPHSGFRGSSPVQSQRSGNALQTQPESRNALSTVGLFGSQLPASDAGFEGTSSMPFLGFGMASQSKLLGTRSAQPTVPVFRSVPAAPDSDFRSSLPAQSFSFGSASQAHHLQAGSALPTTSFFRSALPVCGPLFEGTSQSQAQPLGSGGALPTTQLFRSASAASVLSHSQAKSRGDGSQWASSLPPPPPPPPRTVESPAPTLLSHVPGSQAHGPQRLYRRLPPPPPPSASEVVSPAPTFLSQSVEQVPGSQAHGPQWASILLPPLPPPMTVASPELAFHTTKLAPPPKQFDSTSPALSSELDRNLPAFPPNTERELQEHCLRTRGSPLFMKQKVANKKSTTKVSSRSTSAVHITSAENSSRPQESILHETDNIGNNVNKREIDSSEGSLSSLTLHLCGSSRIERLKNKPSYGEMIFSVANEYSPVEMQTATGKIKKAANYGGSNQDRVEKILLFQTDEGCWLLNENLDDFFRVINMSTKCQQILIQHGLHSLGKTATEHVEQLTATILVMFIFIVMLKPDIFDDFKPLDVELSQTILHMDILSDDEAWILLTEEATLAEKLKIAMKKANEFRCKIEELYPLIYSILELGSNWINVASSLCRKIE